MTGEEKDIYDICLEKKSLYCLKTMGEETCGKCKTYKMYELGLAEGRKEAENQWHDCFLSCSSPYCVGHFPAVKLEGELGNMSKHEGE